MKQKKENRIALLLQWAGEQKIWLLLAILLAMASGLCIIVPYIGIYRLMDAAFQHICTKELVVQTVMMISVSVALRFVLFGCSGVAAHKGAYGALFKVRCMVAEHLAKVPLGTLNERRTGDIKTVLNEDIEKLELFLAHNLPDLVCYMVGPVAIFIYLMTVNIPLALVSLVPLILAVVVMGVMFRNTDGLMDRANRSITTLNSVMIEYISGMKLIKAYNMGSKSFQKFSGAIQEENAMWNETSRRMGPPYATFVVLIECGMLLMVPLGGMFFLKGSLAASAFLLFVYVGSMYLTEIRPLQELGTNFANVLGAITKTKEILDVPVYEGGMDFPENHDIELKNVRFSYDGKMDVLQGVNLKIRDGERMALVGQSGAGKSSAAFTDDCLESIWQRHDKIIAAGFFCSLIDFFLGSVRFTHADIVVNGILEQVHPLENHADLFHQFGERYIPNICTADCHFAGFHIPQPRQKVRNRGFATARRSHKCGHDGDATDHVCCVPWTVP
jgi:ATP-binding cassette, subfamily B, bacterial IrtA/YbtP